LVTLICGWWGARKCYFLCLSFPFCLEAHFSFWLQTTPFSILNVIISRCWCCHYTKDCAKPPLSIVSWISNLYHFHHFVAGLWLRVGRILRSSLGTQLRIWKECWGNFLRGRPWMNPGGKAWHSLGLVTSCSGKTRNALVLHTLLQWHYCLLCRSYGVMMGSCVSIYHL